MTDDSAQARRGPLPPAVMAAAADWLVRLHAGDTSPAERQALADWRRQHPDHERAWRRAERLLGPLGGLPPALGHAALEPGVSPERRRALRRLALMALLGMPLAGAAGALPWGRWNADRRTATGQRSAWQPQPGIALLLNTATAVSREARGGSPGLRLHSGELLVETAGPLRLGVGPGRITTAGGTLLLRRFEGRERLIVLAGAATLGVAGASAPVAAGQMRWFDRRGLGPALAAEPEADAWRRGLLMARRMPLAQLLAELDRYRPGFLHCDPAVAALPVSGAFPVDRPEQALAMLARTFPLRVETRTRFWAIVRPA